MKNIFSFLLVVSIMVFSHQAFAQKMMKDFLKPMPEIEDMDNEAFKQISTLYKEVPSIDEALAYQVRLPKRWSKQASKSLVGLSVSDRVLGEIDRYYGPVRMGDRSYFSVQTMAMKHKLTAEQWLILYLLENGYTIEGVRTIDAHRVEVVYVLIDHNITYIATGVAQTTGDKVMFAQFVAPSENWEEEKQVALPIIESFSLEDIDTSPVEKMTPYRFLDVSEIYYPSSWELKAKPLRSADRMSVSILNVEALNKYSSKRILKGRMQTHLLTEYIIEDIDDDIQTFIDDTSVEELDVQDVIEEYEDFTVHENIEVIEIKSYKALDLKQSLKDYEYWLAVLYSGEYYYFISLLTPSRDDDYASWARNTQSFRLLVEGVTPLI